MCVSFSLSELCFTLTKYGSFLLVRRHSQMPTIATNARYIGKNYQNKPLCYIFDICSFHFQNRISHFDSFEYDADYLKDSHHRQKKCRASFWNIFWSAQSTCITFAFTIAFHTLFCRNIKFPIFCTRVHCQMPTIDSHEWWVDLQNSFGPVFSSFFNFKF